MLGDAGHHINDGCIGSQISPWILSKKDGDSTTIFEEKDGDSTTIFEGNCLVINLP